MKLLVVKTLALWTRYVLYGCYPTCGDYLAGRDKGEWEKCVTDCVTAGCNA